MQGFDKQQTKSEHFRARKFRQQRAKCVSGNPAVIKMLFLIKNAMDLVQIFQTGNRVCWIFLSKFNSLHYFTQNPGIPPSYIRQLVNILSRHERFECNPSYINCKPLGRRLNPLGTQAITVNVPETVPYPFIRA